MEIFMFIIVAGVGAHFIGASVHEGIFVGALVRPHPSLCWPLLACRALSIGSSLALAASLAVTHLECIVSLCWLALASHQKRSV